jgi:hypothetical protein
VRPGLCDNDRVGHATFNEKRAKRVRLDDSVPGLDRLKQLSVLPADGFPEFAIRRFEQLGAPNRDCKAARWADKTPQASDCPVYIWNKENAEDANHGIEGPVSKGKILQVSTAEFYVCQAVLRSPLRSLVQEILCKINSDHLTAWPDAFRRRQCRTTHTTANVEDVHTWSERQTFDRAPAESIPERKRRVIVMIGCGIVGFFQLDLGRNWIGHMSSEAQSVIRSRERGGILKLAFRFCYYKISRGG